MSVTVHIKVWTPYVKGEDIIVTMSCLREESMACPTANLDVRSALVRRLIRAEDDPAKQRIRAWLSEIDDHRLFGFGLTPADIAALRGNRALPSDR